RAPSTDGFSGANTAPVTATRPPAEAGEYGFDFLSRGHDRPDDRMKSKDKKPAKELYRQLRALTCDQLWSVEVPRFDRASPQERIERVSVIRAVSVVFSESGTVQQKAAARPWLRGLLQDPSEKVRRYAMAAMPKLGVGPGEEAELLALLRTTTVEREKKSLGEALEKVGGAATLQEMGRAPEGFLRQTEQKVKARIARSQTPSTVRLDRPLTNFSGLRIHLRGRRGLEPMVLAEVEEYVRAHGQFRINGVRSGLVALTPVAPFSIGDIYSLRCFGEVGFVLGMVNPAEEEDPVGALASTITSPLSQRLLRAFTDGPIRYRLDFASHGHQRGAVRLVTNRAYEFCPDILNDPRSAPWTVSVVPGERGDSVELVPNLTPDPRLYFRLEDVPAASHPPLAASMARLAGPMNDEVVWDPFCGSGLELIERALLGGVRRVIGTDLSAEAIGISQRNFAAAELKDVTAQFACADFRDFAGVSGLGPGTASLVITNPPMGRRVQLDDLHGLIADLVSVAAQVLRPGGRLVFANPVRLEGLPRTLRRESSQVVDMNGFDCRLELYRKVAG
ncbi:MAG TPA: methyltransferase domain-containing protein, partial [Candidatus Limnocylindria bacterium]|nr:methyltransferase domain-containing protein [Candidatus Limnocylindria bacterium]